MELHESQLPGTHEVNFNVSIADIEVARMAHRAPEIIMEMVTNRIVAELLPQIRQHVQENLDYDAITRSIETAIRARLMEESLRGFGVPR